MAKSTAPACELLPSSSFWWNTADLCDDCRFLAARHNRLRLAHRNVLTFLLASEDEKGSSCAELRMLLGQSRTDADRAEAELVRHAKVFHGINAPGRY